ncbi:hypothetical protein ACHAW5_006534 [Stephanodiscus triporus]|uniref:Uncharacterized protein n=1 Tax=Stephanodiscus triporus TaxID=2934178 RepID=A0ABD3PAC7_9STRA
MDGGLNDDEQAAAPKLFSPDVYDDFQSALLLLERRVKEGPGTLSREDLRGFEVGTSNIVREMNEYLADPEGCGDRIARGYGNGRANSEKRAGAVVGDAPAAAVAKVVPPPPPPAAANLASSSSSSSSSPPPPAAPWMAVAPPPPRRGEPGGGKYRRAPPRENRDDVVGGGGGGAGAAAPSSASPPPRATSPPPADAAAAVADDATRYDDDDDDNVRFGLARGTTNTYIIPGMEEMSPEEYREKLQETISARQAERRRRATQNSNIIGNRSSSGYLDALSRGGDGANGGGGGMYKKSSPWKEGK